MLCYRSCSSEVWQFKDQNLEFHRASSKFFSFPREIVSWLRNLGVGCLKSYLNQK